MKALLCCVGGAFAVGLLVGCVIGSSDSPVAAPLRDTYPLDIAIIDDRFIITPCPKAWEGTDLCKWWNDYQTLEEYRYRQLVAAINSRYTIIGEAIRGVAP